MAENEIPEPPDWSDARTFFLEPDLWHEPYELDASESHHLTRVLRIREGEEVRVLDGRGREGRFRVLPYKKNAKAVALRLLDEWTYPEPESKVILAAGWTKAARRGWILEKAVEFEASGIWLWQAERSQFPVPSDIKESWQGQLAAGAKQCRNPWLPELRTMPGGVDELIALAEELGCEHRHVLVESGHKSVMSLTPDTLGQPGRTLCVVGPEGGFTAQEVEKLTRALGGRCRVVSRPSLVEAPAWREVGRKTGGGNFLEKVSSPGPPPSKTFDLIESLTSAFLYCWEEPL